MEKEINAPSFIKNNTEINKRNRAAKAYSDSIKAKERAKAEGNIYFAILILVVLLVFVGSILLKAALYPNENGKGHYKQSDNGAYNYIYVTE